MNAFHGLIPLLPFHGEYEHEECDNIDDELAAVNATSPKQANQMTMKKSIVNITIFFTSQ
jgi:hypothetical protein